MMRRLIKPNAKEVKILFIENDHVKAKKGFSLIELMFVIAIIVILAAVLIPNFSGITDRSKVARVSQDFDSLATALEMYRSDWGRYPVAAEGEEFGKGKDDSVLYKELTGTGSVNSQDNRTITGVEGGIEYVKPATFQHLVSPYNPKDRYGYVSNGYEWGLFVKTNQGTILYRTDSTSALQTATTDKLTLDMFAKKAP